MGCDGGRRCRSSYCNLYGTEAVLKWFKHPPMTLPYLSHFVVQRGLRSSRKPCGPTTASSSARTITTSRLTRSAMNSTARRTSWAGALVSISLDPDIGIEMVLKFQLPTIWPVRQQMSLGSRQVEQNSDPWYRLHIHYFLKHLSALGRLLCIAGWRQSNNTCTHCGGGRH